jgi:hypothetical protein
MGYRKHRLVVDGGLKRARVEKDPNSSEVI